MLDCATHDTRNAKHVKNDLFVVYHLRHVAMRSVNDLALACRWFDLLWQNTKLRRKAHVLDSKGQRSFNKSSDLLPCDFKLDITPIGLCPMR